MANQPIPSAIQAMINADKPIKVDQAKLNKSLTEITAATVIPPIPVNPSKLSGDCKIKSDKQVRDSRANKGSTLAKRINKLTKEIEKVTDCDALQQKLEKAMNDIGDELDSLTKPIQKELEKLFPLIKVPLNPFKLPKFIVKQTIGKILPDIEALIDLIGRIVEVTKALAKLISVAQKLEEKLKACALEEVQKYERKAKDAVEKAALDLEKKIAKSIANSICETLNDAGITLNDLDDALSAVKTIQDAIKTGESVMDGSIIGINQSLSVIDSHQSTVQTLTGIPPVLDTSSIDNFITSVNSPDYTQYKDNVNQIMNLPEPVNEQAPIITGTAAVGNTVVCSDGTWSANGVSNNAMFTYSYQWSRNGTDIYGANTNTYIPVLDDLECNLFCTVTAENHTNIEQAQSAPIGPVIFSLAPANMPTISGLAKNGQTLTCSTGTWPSSVKTIQYEWSRFETANTVQTLSSNNQYKATSADIGSSLVCKVYGQTSKYLLSVNTSNTAIVIA
ncbi:MAG: hypothetical protein EB127_10480 [Alphaproteobacteria bacterium]|nr:hypothetical protein [Alphaproteobacteria bacterium]